MCKGDSDWSWLVGDKVLEVTSGDVGVEEGADVVGVGFLGKSNSDWCWLVGDEVLKVTSGNIAVEEGGNVVTISFLGV